MTDAETTQLKAFRDYWRKKFATADKLLTEYAAQIQQLRLERDEAREQLDRHIAWADEEAKKAEAQIQQLQEENKQLSKEYHLLINENEYAGTRQDWIHRARSAEAEVTHLTARLQAMITNLRETAREDAYNPLLEACADQLEKALKP